MAAWGSLLNIFENPVMSDSLSSWSQLLPKSVDTDTDSSFDMFGDLCHRVNPEPPSSPMRTPRFDKSFSWNTTMFEPDNNNAFEIFGELFYKSKPEDATKPGPSSNNINYNNADRNNGVAAPYYRRSYSDVRPRSRDGGLMIPPPPITSIGKGGKPRVYFKSYRKDGRFVLREIRIPTQQLLHSTRENGRLTMRVADECNVSGEEEDVER